MRLCGQRHQPQIRWCTSGNRSPPIQIVFALIANVYMLYIYICILFRGTFLCLTEEFPRENLSTNTEQSEK